MTQDMHGELGEILDDIAVGGSDLVQLNEKLCEWFPGINSTAAVLEKNNLSPVMFDSVGMPSDVMSTYLDHYWQINPWANFWTTAKSGVTYKSSETFSSARFSDSEFFNDFLLKLNTTEAVAIQLENSENEIITITAMVPESYIGRQEETLARLFDSGSQKLVSTIRTVRQIAAAKGQSIAAGAILARSPDVAIVIDASLRPVAMNDEAEQMMGAQALFDVVNRRFSFQNAGAQKWLATSLTNMIRIGNTFSEQMFLRYRSRYYRLKLTLVSEHDPRDRARGLSRNAMALLQIKDLSAVKAGFGETLVAPVFKLTPGEIRICTSLADGLTVGETASVHGIAVDTVRYHLKSIFAKLEVSRQSELIAFLQKLR